MAVPIPSRLTSSLGPRRLELVGPVRQQVQVAAGRQLTEQFPSLNWLVANIGGSGVFDGSFSWGYNNGLVTIHAGDDINDFTPTAGGQVMVGVQGGPPGNNQMMFVLTRQPSI